jgi:hypothetical protein
MPDLLDIWNAGLRRRTHKKRDGQPGCWLAAL